ncbi:MAG: glycosyltransferase family 2 protein [Candidatus Omnitrophica bacterium]|nr:glycosyltransferase family 2 protein [Candidatus Omnitrophota bacterium]
MIDILIVNYNCAGPLQKLLDALTAPPNAALTKRLRCQITVVDNASTDGSAGMVQNQFLAVQVIERPENDGYSAAVNEGLASTKGSEILLLNSDVLIQLETVAQLSRIWERLEFPAIIGPLHLEEDEFPQLTWGSYPTPKAEARRRRLDRALANREAWAKKAALAESCRTRKVDWVSGSCMFFPRSAAMEIGPWDQNFFLFFEDIDWCLRAKEKGLDVYHTSEARITHLHGASVDQDPDFAELEYRHSQCYFTKKYFGSLRLLQLRFFLTFKFMGRWLIGGRSGFDRSTSWQCFREAWRSPGA